MDRIKTRESVKDIKILDKAAVVSERMKTALVRSKDQAENLMDDGQISPSEYAEDKIRYAAEDVTDQVWHEVSDQTKKAIEKGKEAHREHRNGKRIQKNEERVRRYEEELRRGTPSRAPREDAARQAARQNTEATRTSIRRRRNQTIKSAERTERTIKQSARSAGKQTVKAGAKGTVKSTERAVKTAEKTSKAAIKTAEATAKATQKAAAAAAKAAQKAAEIARQTAIAAYKAAVAAAKAVAAAIKAIAAAMKALVAAIAAGGWVAVVVVVVICLVALIACSCFGIFFSSEDTGSEKTMRQVVQEINMDYQNELDAIKDSVEYDALEMSGSRAVWPEVLSIYAVKTTSDPDNPQEVATITLEKEQLLKDLFWEMNEITHRTETRTETVIVETDDGNGNILEEEVQETITTLYIAVSHKTADEMAAQYGFNENQRQQLAELLAQDGSMWAAVLYGIYGVDDQMLSNAKSSILITGYSLSDYFSDLVDCVIRKSQEGVLVKFFVNDIDSQKSFDRLCRYKGRFLRIYNYPKQEDKMSALHAKVISVDQQDTLITSANLSYHGQEGNIELGTKIHSRDLARQVEDVFTKLVFKKAFVEL